MESSPWKDMYKKQLPSVVIEEGVTSVSYEAFNGCDSLMRVTIASSVIDICGGAFANCSLLSEVNIAANSQMNSIGDSAFFGCVARREPFLVCFISRWAATCYAESRIESCMFAKKLSFHGIKKELFCLQSLLRVIYPFVRKVFGILKTFFQKGFKQVRTASATFNPTIFFLSMSKLH